MYSWKVWCLIVLLLVFILLVKTEITSSRDYNILQNEISNEYAPVKLMNPVPAGGVYQDEEGRIKSGSYFHIQNDSDQEQSITFLLYQHNFKIREDQFFDLEHVYVCINTDTEIEIENGIIKIPGGKTMQIHVEGIARDPSKAMTSRGGSKVEVVKLD